VWHSVAGPLAGDEASHAHFVAFLTFKRFASTVYDAQAGSRSPILDGPWWLGPTAVVVVAVLVFGSSPWQWIVLPVAAALLWMPFLVRWVVALTRSVTAFREGFRS
jgi:hypothetical protein